ncbi:MAG: hypothetical protein JWQ33_2919, partial [Ramlibacter sp.]|nr:hypothetical protein [Ramlibacter sp.]
EQVNRRDLFGAAAFRFRDIEALYFRIDLEKRAGAEAFLDELISPLNFSLDQAGDFDPGFRYRVARHEIVIQLLRYGRMQLADDPPPPLDETDYQSQHELVVLVNVAKVDDGETQMHDGAVYVPAIFVDNPWSKILGRDLQGFEKCLADFCVLKDGQALRLRPDGRLGAGDAASRPLADVGQINLVGVVSNEATSPSPPMLEISYPDGTGSWHAFRRLDPHDLNPLLAQPAWRLQDSDSQKAGLGFTRLELQDRLDQFHSIQSTPVDDRQLQKAWISATCDISDRSDEAPSEMVELIFHALEAAPRGWRILCEMLGAKPGGSVTLSIQTRDWYRSRFSMHLTGHDE